MGPEHAAVNISKLKGLCEFLDAVCFCAQEFVGIHEDADCKLAVSALLLDEFNEIGDKLALPATRDIVHRCAKEVRGPTLALAFWQTWYAEMNIMSVALPLRMIYDHRPWPDVSTPWLVMHVDHGPLTPMHVPSGVYNVGNLRALSDVTRCPYLKKPHWMSLAVARSFESYWRLGSVKAKSEVSSPQRESIVVAHEGRDRLLIGSCCDSTILFGKTHQKEIRGRRVPMERCGLDADYL